MNKLNELITGILSEAKQQEEQRKEYLALVFALLEKTERTDAESNVWRMTFRWGCGKIVFSQNITKRNNLNNI